jgi:hypothetical protein
VRNGRARRAAARDARECGSPRRVGESSEAGGGWGAAGARRASAGSPTKASSWRRGKAARRWTYVKARVDPTPPTRTARSADVGPVLEAGNPYLALVAVACPEVLVRCTGGVRQQRLLCKSAQFASVFTRTSSLSLARQDGSRVRLVQAEERLLPSEISSSSSGRNAAITMSSRPSAISVTREQTTCPGHLLSAVITRMTGPP